MNFGFESMANLGETGIFVAEVGLITDINLARLRQCVHRIQNMMDKREKEVLEEKLLLAVENVKKSFNYFFLMSLLYLHQLVLGSPVASFATMPKPSAAILENQCRGPAAAARTQTHRNFGDQETRHSFSF